MIICKILIVSHKKYDFPLCQIYLPIQVGPANNNFFGIQTDYVGENISAKNYSYCELTGLYWAWKNLDCDYLGLVHYRRYFKGTLSTQLNNRHFRILQESDLNLFISKVDVILPKKRFYFIETNKNQYIHAHHKIGLELTEKVIKEYFPEYLSAWTKTMNMRSGHRFNMFIMKKSLCDDYCQWLFSVLELVEKQVDITDWDKSEQRIFGYLGERLLDVWILTNQIKYKELGVIFLEKQNWPKKIFNFLKRKFVRRKDEL